MGISGKMEESGKQRQTNPRIVRGNPIGVVFVCGHDELRNDASFSLRKESTENKKILWAHLLAFSCYYLCWEKQVLDNEQYCEHIFL